MSDHSAPEVAWRQAQNSVDQSWRNWIKLYVQYLQERSKWLKEKPNLVVGDIVLVCDVNVRRRDWPLGRVTVVHVGRDGLVRSEEVVVCGKRVVWLISKVVHLEF